MHTMFPTLLESTPELEACAQLKNLLTSFLPMCKLPTLPHSTNLFDKNPADDGFPLFEAHKVKNNKYLKSHKCQHLLSKIWMVITGYILAWPVVMMPGPVHQWAWNNISFHSSSPDSSDTEKCFCFSYLFCPGSSLSWAYWWLLCAAHIDPLLSGASQRPVFLLSILEFLGLSLSLC